MRAPHCRCQGTLRSVALWCKVGHHPHAIELKKSQSSCPHALPRSVCPRLATAYERRRRLQAFREHMTSKCWHQQQPRRCHHRFRECACQTKGADLRRLMSHSATAVLIIVSTLSGHGQDGATAGGLRVDLPRPPTRLLGRRCKSNLHACHTATRASHLRDQHMRVWAARS